MQGLVPGTKVNGRLLGPVFLGTVDSYVRRPPSTFLITLMPITNSRGDPVRVMRIALSLDPTKRVSITQSPVTNVTVDYVIEKELA